jgi:hypothetical protein
MDAKDDRKVGQMRKSAKPKITGPTKQRGKGPERAERKKEMGKRGAANIYLAGKEELR